jgi:hypothetical protein
MRYIFTLIAIMIVAGFSVLWAMKAPMISSFLSEQLGLEVDIHGITILPKETKLRYLTVGNAPGFRAANALQIKNTEIHYKLGSFFSNPHEIDEIILKDVQLNIEIRNMKTTDNNWTALGNLIPEHKMKRGVVIHKLVILNLTVHTQGTGAKLLGINGTQTFDRMEFEEINSEDGFPTKELISRIFKKAGIIQYIQNWVIKPIQNLPKKVNPFKVFGTIEDDL